MERSIARQAMTGVLFLGAAGLCSAEGPELQVKESSLFVSGEGGYAVYRIPSMVTTNSGTMLVFAEARKTGKSDHGDIDLVMRSSTDQGRTWGPITVVWDDGDNTCGNPTPVVDRKSGRVVLVSCWNGAKDRESDILAGVVTNTRLVYTLASDDDGATWSKPREITQWVKKPNWRWYATGPCHGVQLSSGRIVIPANHSDEDVTPEFDQYKSHVFYSDDAGETWVLGGVAAARTNESTVVELPDGSLMLNMRSYENVNRRAVAISRDGGASFEKTWLDPQLVESRCQASLLSVSHGGEDYFLFANAADKTRSRMSIKWSGDAAESWNPGLLVYTGPSAYCDLTMADSQTLALAYERDAYSRIDLILVPLSGLLGATQSQVAGGVSAAPIAE